MCIPCFLHMGPIHISAFFYVFIHKLMSFRNFEDCLGAISCMFSHFRPLLRIQKTIFHSHKKGLKTLKLLFVNSLFLFSGFFVVACINSAQSQGCPRPLGLYV